MIPKKVLMCLFAILSWGKPATPVQIQKALSKTTVERRGAGFPVTSQEKQAVEHRSERSAFILGGTQWCGIGNTAANYSDLGQHRATDMCCREHDHCPIKIDAFSIDYGLFNIRPYTVVACSCDESFRQCLSAANTFFSQQVGHVFFDIVQPPCLELSDKPVKRCVQWSWWGWCTKYERQRTATFSRSQQFQPAGPINSEEGD